MNRKEQIVKGLLMSVMLATAIPTASAAGGDVLTLMVKGTPVEINPAEHPVITYKANTLHIKTEASSIDIPVSDISGGAFPKTVVHGDVNGDFNVDVADIASVITVMANVGADPVSVRNADVNGDGNVDVADIATVISIMAGK